MKAPAARILRALGTTLALAALSAAPDAASLPLYAAREGATCITCHVDPNGGGARNGFGFVYLKNRHGLDTEERWAGVTVDPKLNDWITVGLDTRVLYVASHVNGSGSNLTTSTFFPMQGQFNVTVMPHEHLTLVASHGIVVDAPGFPGGYVAREIFGMFDGLPGDLYARAGRFRVPFGLRQDDHTSFVRDLRFLSYDAQKPDAGIEVGRVGGRFFVQASFTNGGAPFSQRAQALAAKVGWAGRPVLLGASVYHRFRETLGVTDDRAALYVGAANGALALLAEAAVGTTETAFGSVDLGAGFAELNYRASRGVNLRAKVDYADLALDAGGGEMRRYLGEVDINPVPFAEAKLSYRYYDDEAAGIYHEYLGQLYFPF